MKRISGTGVALITPFNEDKTIDYTSLDKLINKVIEGGIDFLVILAIYFFLCLYLSHVYVLPEYLKVVSLLEPDGQFFANTLSNRLGP